MMKWKGVLKMPVVKLKMALNEILDAGLTVIDMKVEYGGVTMFSSEQVFNELADNYSSYKCMVSELYQPTTAAFLALYLHYRDNTKAQLYRAYTAMQAAYNPINNYDMIEESADGKRIDTETVTPTGGTEVKTTTEKTGLNSTTPGKLTDTVTTSSTPKPGAKTETSYGNTKSIEFDGGTKTGYHEGTEHFLKRSGNIGVTTSAQMIAGELEIRKRDLLREWIKEFIDRYCYVVGGVDE